MQAGFAEYPGCVTIEEGHYVWVIPMEECMRNMYDTSFAAFDFDSTPGLIDSEEFNNMQHNIEVGKQYYYAQSNWGIIFYLQKLIIGDEGWDKYFSIPLQIDTSACPNSNIYMPDYCTAVEYSKFLRAYFLDEYISAESRNMIEQNYNENIPSLHQEQLLLHDDVVNFGMGLWVSNCSIVGIQCEYGILAPGLWGAIGYTNRAKNIYMTIHRQPGEEQVAEAIYNFLPEYAWKHPAGVEMLTDILSGKEWCDFVCGAQN